MNTSGQGKINKIGDVTLIEPGINQESFAPHQKGDTSFETKAAPYNRFVYDDVEGVKIDNSQAVGEDIDLFSDDED